MLLLAHVCTGIHVYRGLYIFFGGDTVQHYSRKKAINIM